MFGWNDTIQKMLTNSEGSGKEMSEVPTKEMAEPKCEMGCCHFYGGEIKHLPSCVFYPESLSKIYDDMSKRLAHLETDNNTLQRTLSEYRKSLDIAEASCRKLEAEKAALRKILTSDPTEEMVDAGRIPIRDYECHDVEEGATYLREGEKRPEGHFPKGRCAIYVWRAMTQAALLTPAEDALKGGA